MWLFLSAIVVCLTLVVLFRIYLDLKRQEQQHYRLMQSDRIQYGKYLEVTSTERPRAEMPDLSGNRMILMESGRELIYKPSAFTEKGLRQLEGLARRDREARALWGRERKNIGTRGLPFIDPRMTEFMNRE